MAEGDDSKEPFQMIANLDLQTLNISVNARLDVAKLNLMLSSDCSQIGTGSSNSPRSAKESFSICNSARDDPNTRLRGRFRIACGSGERSEPRIQPICGSFYPQKSDSGPRRKWAGPGGIRRPRSIALRIAQLLSGTGLSQTENVGRDGEWQSP